jgi:hypothetical protein
MLGSVFGCSLLRAWQITDRLLEQRQRSLLEAISMLPDYSLMINGLSAAR